jgi:protein TonB
MSDEVTSPPVESARRRARQVLVAALGASVALHAALLAFVPGWGDERPAPVQLAALVVTLSAPPPPPPAQERAMEPAPPVPAGSAAQPMRRQPEAAAMSALPAARSAPRIAHADASASRAEPAPAAEAARASEPLAVAPAAPAPARDAPAVPAVVSAAYLDSPAPRYPDAARRLGQEGTVTLRVLVTAEGSPARVALERSSGSLHLDGAALERVRNWRFRPARQGSAPVESWVIVPIVFRLEGNS